MFAKKASTEPTELDRAITQAHNAMLAMTPGTDMHAKTVDELTKLYALKETPSRVSKDSLVNGFVSILGIVVIVGYEQRNVMVSKALGFVPKFVR